VREVGNIREKPRSCSFAGGVLKSKIRGSEFSPHRLHSLSRETRGPFRTVGREGRETELRSWTIGQRTLRLGTYFVTPVGSLPKGIYLRSLNPASERKEKAKAERRSI